MTPEQRRKDNERRRLYHETHRERGCVVRVAWKHGCDTETVYRCRASRCIICNIPPWTHMRYGMGPMQVGHIVPGVLSGGLEPMCKKCNRFLGVRALTEKTGREVLYRSRRYWSRLQMRDEAWQHTDVDERGFGYGGVNDSPGRARKLEGFNEGRKHGEGASGRTDSGGSAVPAVGENGSVVLAEPAGSRHPEE